MQYYTYNDNLGQNEYQKIFVDSITQKDRIVTIGKQLFEIFTTFSSEPPVGALPLNGYEIIECNTKLPEFWNECVRRKKAGVIPCVINGDVYDQILSAQNGNCGYFYIEDNLESENYGTVKLPCLNTAVLANIMQLKEVDGIIQTSGEIISSELGAYYKGNNISHIHTYKRNYVDTNGDNIQTQTFSGLQMR